MALDGYVLSDAEKDHLLQVIRHFTSIYFADVPGFCIMGDHFHLVVRMHPDEGYSDAEIQRRYVLYYQDDDTKEPPLPGQMAMLRYKWQQLSEMMKEIKQSFARYYNKRHNRRGFFWGERFKSVLVEDGETLINCLAYVDLNPIRAGLVARPDDCRWSSARSDYCLPRYAPQRHLPKLPLTSQYSTATRGTASGVCGIRFIGQAL